MTEFTVYIRYNKTGEIETWDTAYTLEEAEAMIAALKADDEQAERCGVPICDCTYFIETDED